MIFKHKQQISTYNRQQSKSKEQRHNFYSGSAISGLRPLQIFFFYWLSLKITSDYNSCSDQIWRKLQQWCYGMILAASGLAFPLQIFRPLFWMTRGSIYRRGRLKSRLKPGEVAWHVRGGPRARVLGIRAQFGIDSKWRSNRSRIHPIELKFGVNILQHVCKLL